MSRIKKFVIYNIFLSLFLITTLCVLSWAWKNYLDDTSVKFLELERKKIKNLKIINIGSSHTTYGIKYPKDIKAYNLGLSGQKFYYDYEVLKKYQSKFEENCLVIIPISIFSFYSCYDAERISKNYIQILNQEVLIGINKKEFFLGKYFSITQPIVRIFHIL